MRTRVDARFHCRLDEGGRNAAVSNGNGHLLDHIYNTEYKPLRGQLPVVSRSGRGSLLSNHAKQLVTNAQVSIAENLYGRLRKAIVTKVGISPARIPANVNIVCLISFQ